MKASLLDLKFPVGGLVRRTAYQDQQPGTTNSAMNVWPVGPANARVRGGRRAGLYNQVTGTTGGTYRCLAPVPKASDTSYDYRLMCASGTKWYYPVAGGALTEWTTGTLSSSSGRVPWAVRFSVLYYLDGTTLKVMDPYAPSLATVTATAGSIPTGCNLLAKYRDRLVMAPWRGQLWYMSRVGSSGDGWTDWDYAADSDDTQRAVWAGSADAGALQEPLNAMAPWGDDYMVLGCDNSLWVLRGDPAMQGEINSISRKVGIIGPDAWCYTPENYLVFVDWSGIYVLPPGASGTPEPLSREKLPSDLRNIDPATYDAVLRYDDQHDGMLLSITPVAGASESDPGEHWWIDWPTKSFWQLSFPVAKIPRFFEPFQWAAGYDNILSMGCDDGYLRQFDDTTVTDDGTAVTGYVSIGPFRVAGDSYRDGMIRELTGTMSSGSGNVTWNIYAANDADAVSQSSTVKKTGTWIAGRNYTQYPRVRGGAGVLELSGTTLWEYEGAMAVVTQLGKQRV